MARHPAVLERRVHGGRVEHLPAFPRPPVQEEPTDPGHGVRAVGAAAPGRHQGQAVHGRHGAVAHRPFRIGHAQRSHDPALQEGAEVRIVRAPEARRHAVAEHRHAGVAVALLRAGHVEHGCPVPGEGERVERRRQALPEVPLPAGQAVVGEAVRLGVLDPRGVGRQVPDGDLPPLRVVTPLRHVPAGRVVGLDPPVAHRHHQADPAHEGLGHRGGAVRLRPAVAGGVPLEHDPVVADDEEGGGVPVLQGGPGRFEPGCAHPLALGGCRGPVPRRLALRCFARGAGRRRRGDRHQRHEMPEPTMIHPLPCPDRLHDRPPRWNIGKGGVEMPAGGSDRPEPS